MKIRIAHDKHKIVNETTLKAESCVFFEMRKAKHLRYTQKDWTEAILIACESSKSQTDFDMKSALHIQNMLEQHIF